jgi:molybdate transport system substrate-binding protein
MTKRWPILMKLTLATAAALTAAPSSFGQIRVIISGGFSSAYHEVLPEFESETGIKVITESGASQGKGNDTISSQLQRGVTADVVIISREGLNDLITENRIAAGTAVDLAKTPIGMSVRAGQLKPEIATVAEFKQALVQAKIIAIPTSTTGIYLTGKVLPQLGIDKAIVVKSTTRGADSVALVARGEAAVSLQPVSEILHVPGVDLVGAIPTEIQYISVFSAAIVAGSKQPEAARKLIAFLTSEKATTAIRNSGMDPVTSH